MKRPREFSRGGGSRPESFTVGDLAQTEKTRRSYGGADGLNVRLGLDAEFRPPGLVTQPPGLKTDK